MFHDVLNGLGYNVGLGVRWAALGFMKDHDGMGRVLMRRTLVMIPCFLFFMSGLCCTVRRRGMAPEKTYLGRDEDRVEHLWNDDSNHDDRSALKSQIRISEYLHNGSLIQLQTIMTLTPFFLFRFF